MSQQSLAYKVWEALYDKRKKLIKKEGKFPKNALLTVIFSGKGYCVVKSHDKHSGYNANLENKEEGCMRIYGHPLK